MAVTPVPTDRFLELNFSSRVKDADVLRVFALASRHGLIVYDPEAPSVYLPGAPTTRCRDRPVLTYGQLQGEDM